MYTLMDVSPFRLSFRRVDLGLNVDDLTIGPVDDVDGENTKLVLYYSLQGEKEMYSSTWSTQARVVMVTVQKLKSVGN